MYEVFQLKHECIMVMGRILLYRVREVLATESGNLG